MGDSTEVAVAVGSDMSVALGANYKIDGDSNVKSKVDKEVIICESVASGCLILGAAASSGVGMLSLHWASRMCTSRQGFSRPPCRREGAWCRGEGGMVR